ncbi:mitochondrial dicarboxylate carrier-like, partial [Mizuhopecten yessoensis]
VHLQTQQTEKVKVTTLVGRIIKNDGVLGIYNGLSASICRQLTYSTTRFAIYETIKKQLTKDGSVMPFYQKVGTAVVSGAMGGFVGTPADLINV